MARGSPGEPRGRNHQVVNPPRRLSAWPTVALAGSYVLLMMIIRSGQGPAGATAVPGVADCTPDAGPLQVQAAQAFAGELAAERVPSVRAIRAGLHVGRPRAQWVRAYLAEFTSWQQADGPGASGSHSSAPRKVLVVSYLARLPDRNSA